MNGTIFSEEYKEQIKEKEMLLEMIRKAPISCGDLREETGFSTEKMSRYLTSLKHFNLVAQQTAAEQPNKLLRKYYSISDAKFEEKLLESFAKAEERRIQKRIAMEKEKQAMEANIKSTGSGIRIVKADDYHTRGNKSRVNSWSGYTSF